MDLSFQNELTFSPKLNSLSLKLAAVNRTSILERLPKKKNAELDRSYTFKPVVSHHSSKIVAKLKTGFLERQKQHVKNQKEKIGQGPSTIHPNLKNCKEAIDTKEKYEKKTLSNSLSDQTCQRTNTSQYLHPHSRSLEDTVTLNETLKQTEIETKRLLKQNRNKDKFERTIKSNCFLIKKDVTTKKEAHLSENQDVTELEMETNEVQIEKLTNTPTQSKARVIVVKSVDATIDNDYNTNIEQSAIKVTDQNYVNIEQSMLKAKTDKMDLEHQKLVKVKKVACQAIQSKKVFVCNGPYSTLRSALRRRGWIEKYFKVVDSSSNKECKRLTSKRYRLDSGFTSDDNEINQTDIFNQTKEHAIQKTTEDYQTTESPKITLIDGQCEKGNVETHKDRNVKQSKSVCRNEVFPTDSQYGIMSRVVRNAIPTLIWTLKRDDIDFRLLQKDQIVNHYASANTFTTKTGLCMNLRNVVSFNARTWQTFFPRCYRLCCDEEKQDFIEEYRLTTLQSIMKIVLMKYQEWKNVEEEKCALSEELQKGCYEDVSDSPSLLPKKKHESELEKQKYPIILPTHVFSLVFKKCYLFLDMKIHLDIEEEYDVADESIEDLHWSTIVNYYYQVINKNAIITNAWKYVEECRSILKQMEKYCPQMKIDGYNNLWILKPGAKSRGRGIEIKNHLNEISSLVSGSVSKKENRWVIQKYIERPMLIYRTKFDIRQWFLVTDWNPLMLWFYQDCYIRFCSQEFTLTKFDVQVHLSNNSVQKHFQNGIRSEHLPETNMWSSDSFKEYLKKIGKDSEWDSKIYPGMKSAIIAALQSCQNDLEYRKNSFELYGADFMLCEDMNPWLIEINSSPALGASTPVTEVLCRNVLEDTLKVVLDRRENKQCNVGRFELAFRQQYISIPSYMGCNLSINGTAIKPPVPSVIKIVKEKIIDTKENIVKADETEEVTKPKDKENTDNIQIPKLTYETVNKKASSVTTRLDGIIAKLNMKREKRVDEDASCSKQTGVHDKNSAGNEYSNSNNCKALTQTSTVVNNEKTNCINDHCIQDPANGEEIKSTFPDTQTNANKIKESLNYTNSLKVVSTRVIPVVENNGSPTGKGNQEDQPQNNRNKLNTVTATIDNNNNNNIRTKIDKGNMLKKKYEHNRKNYENYQKVRTKQDPKYNGTFEPNEKVKPPSPEPVPFIYCCASDESITEALYPQVASHDLRKIKSKTQNDIKQDHRLKKINSKDLKPQNGTYKWLKQYGVLDTEYITGIKQVHNHPPLLLNQYRNSQAVKNFRIKPKSYRKSL